jgi:hypothetical protein
MGIIGFRIDYFQLASALDLVEVVVFLNAEVADDLLSSDIFTLKGTLILDLLWKARNSKVYDERSVEIGDIMNSFRSLWRDHSSILKVSGTTSCTCPFFNQYLDQAPNKIFELNLISKRSAQ